MSNIPRPGPSPAPLPPPDPTHHGGISSSMAPADSVQHHCGWAELFSGAQSCDFALSHRAPQLRLCFGRRSYSFLRISWHITKISLCLHSERNCATGLLVLRYLKWCWCISHNFWKYRYWLQVSHFSFLYSCFSVYFKFWYFVFFSWRCFCFQTFVLQLPLTS